MGKIRPLNSEKFGISKNRFKELYYWCLQYNEWKNELKYKEDTVGAVKISDIPANSRSGVPRNPTQSLAVRRVQLEENCRMVEQTAIDTDETIYQYLIKAVTDSDITYEYLKMMMDIPCSHNTYYDRRRKFYWLLSQRKVS